MKTGTIIKGIPAREYHQNLTQLVVRIVQHLLWKVLLVRVLTITILNFAFSRDETSVVDMYVRFDNEVVDIFDYVGKDEKGMPDLQYRQDKKATGKYLEFM